MCQTFFELVWVWVWGIIRSVIYPKSHSYPCYYMLRYTLSPMVPHVNLTVTYYHDNCTIRKQSTFTEMKGNYYMKAVHWKQITNMDVKGWHCSYSQNYLQLFIKLYSLKFQSRAFSVHTLDFILFVLCTLAIAQILNNACCTSGPRRILWHLTCLSKLPYQHQ